MISITAEFIWRADILLRLINSISRQIRSKPWNSKEIYKWLAHTRRIIFAKQVFFCSLLSFNCMSFLQVKVILNACQRLADYSIELSLIIKQRLLKLIKKGLLSDLGTKKQKNRIKKIDPDNIDDFILGKGFSKMLSIIEQKIIRLYKKRERNQEFLSPIVIISQPKVLTYTEHLHDYNNKNGMGWRNYYTSSSTYSRESRPTFRRFRN